MGEDRRRTYNVDGGDDMGRYIMSLTGNILDLHTGEIANWSEMTKSDSEGLLFDYTKTRYDKKSNSIFVDGARPIGIAGNLSDDYTGRSIIYSASSSDDYRQFYGATLTTVKWWQDKNASRIPGSESYSIDSGLTTKYNPRIIPDLVTGELYAVIYQGISATNSTEMWDSSKHKPILYKTDGSVLTKRLGAISFNDEYTIGNNFISNHMYYILGSDWGVIDLNNFDNGTVTLVSGNEGRSINTYIAYLL